MKLSFGFAAVCSLALVLGTAEIRAATVYFGNYAPETALDTGSLNGSTVNSTQYYGVAFTTGSEALQITSLDLGLVSLIAPSAGLRVFLAAEAFPDSSTLLSFSTSQGIPSDTAERITFLPDAEFTLQPDTTYWVRLQWDASAGDVFWTPALDTPDVTSTYTNYFLTYGSYGTISNVDRGAYYVTAVTAVPEASTSALAIGGLAVLAGIAHRVRRHRQAE